MDCHSTGAQCQCLLSLHGAGSVSAILIHGLSKHYGDVAALDALEPRTWPQRCHAIEGEGNAPGRQSAASCSSSNSSAVFLPHPVVLFHDRVFGWPWLPLPRALVRGRLARRRGAT